MKFRDWPPPSTLPVDGGLGEAVKLVILAFVGATLTTIGHASFALARAVDKVGRVDNGRN